MARRAKSLQRLLDQVNAAYPGRNKASDGWIGDTTHAARPSDHNPDASGVVKAQDITHDPGHKVDGVVLAPLWALDPRTNYTIFNRKIYQNGSVKPYTGANPHDKHIHISVKDGLKDDTHPWDLNKKEDSVSTVADNEIDQMSWAYFGYGASQEFIKEHRGKESNTFIRFMFNHPVAVTYREKIAAWRKAAESGTYTPVTEQLFKKG